MAFAHCAWESAIESASAADYQRQCDDERDARDAPARVSERCAHVSARQIAERVVARELATTTRGEADSAVELGDSTVPRALSILIPWSKHASTVSERSVEVAAFDAGSYLFRFFSLDEHDFLLNHVSLRLTSAVGHDPHG